MGSRKVMQHDATSGAASSAQEQLQIVAWAVTDSAVYHVAMYGAQPHRILRTNTSRRYVHGYRRARSLGSEGDCFRRANRSTSRRRHGCEVDAVTNPGHRTDAYLWSTVGMGS